MIQKKAPVWKMPHFLLVPLFVSCGICCAETAAESSRPPNIVLLLADDQGYGDVGFSGNEDLKTPHIDRLASEGTLFTSFYVSPVCSPTRASLLTGRYHQRTGVIGVVEGREFMTEQEITVAEMLKEEGYATGLIGKWHLGENYPWVPHAQGFDEFIGFRDGSSPYFDAMLEQNGSPYPTNGYLTDVLTDEAIRYIDRHEDEPFFLYVSYSAPHTPLEAPSEYLESYAHLPQKTQFVYAMMASLDDNIGRLLERIGQPDLRENTLVIYLSDNGPIYGGTVRYNNGLRDAKYTVYEGGIRVPMILSWPGRIDSGRTITDLAAHIDLTPTIIDYAGGSLPADRVIDGQSLLPLLEGSETVSFTDRALFMAYPGEEGVRHREPAPYPGGMMIQGNYKMVNGRELYDIRTDPGEAHNIAAEYPRVVETMDKKYRAFWKDVSAENQPYPRVPVGYAAENPSVLSSFWAVVSGGLRYFPQRFTEEPRYRDTGVHKDWIGLWNAEGAATWRLNFHAAGRYQLSLRLSVLPAQEPVTVTARIGEVILHGKLPKKMKEGHEWIEYPLGVFEISAGSQDIVLTMENLSADPRQVELKDIVLEQVH